MTISSHTSPNRPVHLRNKQLIYILTPTFSVLNTILPWLVHVQLSVEEHHLFLLAHVHLSIEDQLFPMIDSLSYNLISLGTELVMMVC